MSALNRRKFMSTCSALGLSSTAFPQVLWGMVRNSAETSNRISETSPLSVPVASTPKVTRSMINDAATVAGITIDEKQTEMMVSLLNSQLGYYDKIRALHLSNSVQSALIFNPVLPGMRFDETKRPMKLSRAPAIASAPKNLEEVAFYPVPQLSELVRARKVSSAALTDMYIERLKRYDPTLKFVVTFTEDRARTQAREADREIAAGKYRGPLHGLPWGAKDLLAVKGYRTTWGAGGFENQVIDEDATVVKRLDSAGAVLVAKTTLGALANGDVWFGGKTRNPWKPDEGSSGSSAGSASATAAGCMAFSIGSETWGSISSPSSRCGVTGLRPTFGRVPRTGAMTLCWSMDHLGPLCRSVEDCAIVLREINGPDGGDRSCIDVPFSWNSDLDVKTIRVGYIKADFQAEPKFPPDNPDEKLTPEESKQRAEFMEQARKDQVFLLDALKVFPKLGIQLVPIDLPDLPPDPLQIILLAESAAAFDELTRTGRDKLLTAQGKDDWPNIWRSARFIPAVDYINANRARTLLMDGMSKVFQQVDVLLGSSSSDQSLITNLTGQPSLTLPNGFRPADGTPTSITLLGQLFGEEKLLAVGRAYQEATGFQTKHPKL